MDPQEPPRFISPARNTEPVTVLAEGTDKPRTFVGEIGSYPIRWTEHTRNARAVMAVFGDPAAHPIVGYALMDGDTSLVQAAHGIRQAPFRAYRSMLIADEFTRFEFRSFDQIWGGAHTDAELFRREHEYVRKRIGTKRHEEILESIPEDLERMLETLEGMDIMPWTSELNDEVDAGRAPLTERVLKIRALAAHESVYREAERYGLIVPTREAKKEIRRSGIAEAHDLLDAYETLFEGQSAFSTRSVVGAAMLIGPMSEDPSIEGTLKLFTGDSRPYKRMVQLGLERNGNDVNFKPHKRAGETPAERFPLLRRTYGSTITVQQRWIDDPTPREARFQVETSDIGLEEATQVVLDYLRNG